MHINQAVIRLSQSASNYQPEASLQRRSGKGVKEACACARVYSPEGVLLAGDDGRVASLRSVAWGLGPAGAAVAGGRVGGAAVDGPRVSGSGV